MAFAIDKRRWNYGALILFIRHSYSVGFFFVGIMPQFRYVAFSDVV